MNNELIFVSSLLNFFKQFISRSLSNEERLIPNKGLIFVQNHSVSVSFTDLDMCDDGDLRFEKITMMGHSREYFSFLNTFTPLRHRPGGFSTTHWKNWLKNRPPIGNIP